MERIKKWFAEKMEEKEERKKIQKFKAQIDREAEIEAIAASKGDLIKAKKEQMLKEQKEGKPKNKFLAELEAMGSKAGQNFQGMGRNTGIGSTDRISELMGGRKKETYVAEPEPVKTRKKKSKKSVTRKKPQPRVETPEERIKRIMG